MPIYFSFTELKVITKVIQDFEINRHIKRFMKDITIKLYPEGRHEMLNECNKAEVYQDILDWLER